MSATSVNPVQERREQEPYFEIRPLGSVLQEKAARCLAEVFTRDNPLVEASGVAASEFLPVAEQVVSEAAEAGLSFVATIEGGEKVVGISIAEDFAAVDHIRDLEYVPETLRPLLALFGLFDATIRSRFDVTPGDLLYHSFLGVDRLPGRAGPGGAVTAALCEKTFARARKKNFHSAIGYATHLFSQRLYRKLGFETIDEIAYANYIFEGVPVYRDVRWHQQAILGVRRL